MDKLIDPPSTEVGRVGGRGRDEGGSGLGVGSVMLRVLGSEEEIGVSESSSTVAASSSTVLVVKLSPPLPRASAFASFTASSSIANVPASSPKHCNRS